IRSLRPLFQEPFGLFVILSGTGQKISGRSLDDGGGAFSTSCCGMRVDGAVLARSGKQGRLARHGRAMVALRGAGQETRSAGAAPQVEPSLAIRSFGALTRRGS